MRWFLPGSWPRPRLVGSLTEPYHYTTELIVFALAAASLAPKSPEWWLALASYPLLWMDGHITNPLALGLGLAGPTGWRVVPFLAITGINLVGAVLLWLACAIALGRHPSASGTGGKSGLARFESSKTPR